MIFCQSNSLFHTPCKVSNGCVNFKGFSLNQKISSTLYCNSKKINILSSRHISFDNGKWMSLSWIFNLNYFDINCLIILLLLLLKLLENNENQDCCNVRVLNCRTGQSRKLYSLDDDLSHLMDSCEVTSRFFILTIAFYGYDLVTKTEKIMCLQQKIVRVVMFMWCLSLFNLLYSSLQGMV